MVRERPNKRSQIGVEIGRVIFTRPRGLEIVMENPVCGSLQATLGMMEHDDPGDGMTSTIFSFIHSGHLYGTGYPFFLLVHTKREHGSLSVDTSGILQDAT